PDGHVPPEQVLAAPDVVDEDVEPALFVVDALDQRAHLRGIEVVGGHRDAGAAGLGDEVGGVLDGLGAVVLGAAGAGGAAGHVDGRAGGAQFHGDAASGAPGRPCHQCDPVLELLRHVRPPVTALCCPFTGWRVSRTSSVAFSGESPGRTHRPAGRRPPAAQWPRAIHSSRCGASAPMVVLSPWPVRTSVSGGRVSSRSRIESMIVGKWEYERPVAPGPPWNRVSPVKTVPRPWS